MINKPSHRRKRAQFLCMHQEVLTYKVTLKKKMCSAPLDVSVCKCYGNDTYNAGEKRPAAVRWLQLKRARACKLIAGFACVCKLLVVCRGQIMLRSCVRVALSLKPQHWPIRALGHACVWECVCEFGPHAGPTQLLGRISVSLSAHALRESLSHVTHTPLYIFSIHLFSHTYISLTYISVSTTLWDAAYK